MVSLLYILTGKKAHFDQGMRAAATVHFLKYTTLGAFSMTGTRINVMTNFRLAQGLGGGIGRKEIKSIKET